MYQCKKNTGSSLYWSRVKERFRGPAKRSQYSENVLENYMLIVDHIFVVIVYKYVTLFVFQEST